MQEEHDFFLKAFGLISDNLPSMSNLLKEYKEQVAFYRNKKNGYLNWEEIKSLRARSYTRAVHQTKHFLGCVFDKQLKNEEVQELRTNISELMELVKAIKEFRRKPLGRGGDQQIERHRHVFDLWVQMHDFLFRWQQKLPEDQSCSIM